MCIMHGFESKIPIIGVFADGDHLLWPDKLFSRRQNKGSEIAYLTKYRGWFSFELLLGKFRNGWNCWGFAENKISYVRAWQKVWGDSHVSEICQKMQFLGQMTNYEGVWKNGIAWQKVWGDSHAFNWSMDLIWQKIWGDSHLSKAIWQKT